MVPFFIGSFVSLGHHKVSWQSASLPVCSCDVVVSFYALQYVLCANLFHFLVSQENMQERIMTDSKLS